tara:strand:+ start:879 stop:1340 length:462 start_codon:yes stop_codon:yes gene_type:complete
MVLNQIIAGINTHNEFVFFNTGIHLIAGVLIATAIYPFLSRKLQKKYNYILLAFFPAVLGSIFPDLILTVSTLIQHRAIYGLFEALTAGEMLSFYHFGLPLILIVPTVVLTILIINRIFKKTVKQFPAWSFRLVFITSILSILLHIYLDGVGF